jgi:hypothetical protein
MPGWRTALAVLISLALVLSFFHGWNADDGSSKPTISIAHMSCGGSGKIPADAPAPHGDHCLAHMASVAPQDTTTVVEYVVRGYRFGSMRVPDATDRASPFKPPRA